MENSPERKPRKDHLKEPFLRAFPKIGTISGAGKAVGVSRFTVLIWRKLDKEFDEKFKHAKTDLVESLESNVLEMAMDKTHPSHLGANIFLLKAHAPDTYTDRLRHEADPMQFEKIIGLFTGVIKRAVPPDLWPTVSAALDSACASLQTGKGQELLS